jgi:PmbA protein
MEGREVYHCSGASTNLVFTGGELKIRETDFSSGYGVRALKDGRVGFAYCQHKDALKKAIKEAEKLSRFSVESNFSFAPKAGFKKPDIHDPSLDPSDYEMLRGFVDEAKDGAQSLGGKAKAIASVASSDVKLENTAGFSGEYAKTDFSMYVECMHGDGFGISSLSCNKMPEQARDLALKAAGMAKDMQGAKKPESGIYIVVMEIEAIESVLGVLIPSFSGDWKRRGMTLLEKGKKHFSEQLSICEDGLSGASEARPFDDEGVPSGKRFLVKNGVVDSLLYDRETAALDNEVESGACSRSSYDEPPSIRPSNIVVSPGTWKDLGELERYIELHYAHGSHTANLTTGDIGLEVSGAFLVEKNKRTPVKGFMLTGNVFDWFANIEAIEKRPRTHDWLISPRIAFKSVHAVS